MYPQQQQFGAVPIGAAISLVGGLVGGDSKDPERLAKNAALYSEAIAGDPDALNALKGMSGRFGLIKAGRYCSAGGCSGWATPKAKDDAYQKYQAAIAQLQGQSQLTPGLPSSPLPATPGALATTQQTGVIGGVNLTQLAIAGAGLVLLSVLVNQPKSRQQRRRR